MSEIKFWKLLQKRPIKILAHIFFILTIMILTKNWNDIGSF